MIDSFGRPDWDAWFITICCVVSQRSLDPHTKHGCVVIDADKTILSLGYNGPPRGCADADIPLTRPEKYKYMSHAEVNAITNAARSGVSLKGSTFYITGMPCQDCFRHILNVGAKRIVYGVVGSVCIKPEDEEAIQRMNAAGRIEFTTYTNTTDIFELLTTTSTYIQRKIDEGLKA
jgi:dCMP deaminase